MTEEAVVLVAIGTVFAAVALYLAWIRKGPARPS